MVGVHTWFSTPECQDGVQSHSGRCEEEHAVVQYVQGEHYKRIFLRVWVKVSGSDGNRESSPVHKRSAMSVNLSSKSQFPNSEHNLIRVKACPY